MSVYFRDSVFTILLQLINHNILARRPAFVVSNIAFNQYTKMAIVCPITNIDRGYIVRVGKI
ncbi:MAG: type II toxin-antitoxin system PemK/MazF family toxin [Firmicutes bacterium]|nr:type II toxin-antitoxin system PemK/MazF family toxin [Bacillota bacterium]